MEDQKECPFCKSQATRTVLCDRAVPLWTCPCCGEFFCCNTDEIAVATDEIASYLYYTGNASFHKTNEYFTNVIGDAQGFVDYGFDKDKKGQHRVDCNIIKAFYPTSFAKRIATIMQGFVRRSAFFSDAFEITRGELDSALFTRRYDENGKDVPIAMIQRQTDKLLSYLEKECKYISVRQEKTGFELSDKYYITVESEGWKLVETFQADDKNNKNVFVSMSFADDTKGTRDAIRRGITDAGYSAEFIDEIIHNRQIVPEMFRLIRECRFLVLDISEPNYGAYYEAGYAQGLNKEVIICCSTEARDKKPTGEDAKYDKYLHPHFDIAQKQILFWNDYEDLTVKLAEWIRSIIG